MLLNEFNHRGHLQLLEGMPLTGVGELTMDLRNKRSGVMGKLLLIPFKELMQRWISRVTHVKIINQPNRRIIKLFRTMDDILQNSYFKNTVKHKYSFSKMNRFPELKSQYKNDFYDRSSIMSKRSTSFGYGSKYDMFKERQRSPGPFTYTLENQSKNSHNTISFGAGRDKVVANCYIDPEKIKTPRVGIYENGGLNLKKKSPSGVIVGRKPCDSFIQPNHMPEAGKYNPIDTFYSRRKRSLNFGFGSSKRFQYEKSKQKNDNKSPIGPGSYETQAKLRSSHAKFGNAKRKTYAVEELEKSISPGPIYFVK